MLTRQIAGRFLKEYTADDLLFGNIFDRPLKLPWVFSVAVKFMKCAPLSHIRAPPLLTQACIQLRRPDT